MRNLSTLDRAIRLFAGPLLVGLNFWPPVSAWLTGLGVGLWLLPILGVGLFINGLSGFCFAYKMLGLSTCPIKPSAS